MMMSFSSTFFLCRYNVLRQWNGIITYEYERYRMSMKCRNQYIHFGVRFKDSSYDILQIHTFVVQTWKALQPFLRTGQAKKLLQTYNNNMASFQEIHRTIWPGESIELLASKTSRKFRDEEQQNWFYELTMPTSMFFACITYFLSGKHRNLIDRAHAATAFSALCTTICSHSNGLSLEHTQLGSGQTIMLDVDHAGSIVDSKTFWTEMFFVGTVRRTWNQDFDSSGKSWVQNASGLGKNLLSDLICFCLDPQHSSTLRDALRESVLLLISHLAKTLDDGASRFAHSSAELDVRQTGCKNKKRLATNIKTVWTQRVAHKIWRGEDTRSGL